MRVVDGEGARGTGKQGTTMGFCLVVESDIAGTRGNQAIQVDAGYGSDVAVGAARKPVAAVKAEASSAREGRMHHGTNTAGTC